MKINLETLLGRNLPSGCTKGHQKSKLNIVLHRLRTHCFHGTRNTYQGVANNGMKIDMFLDQSGKIISAFPEE